MPGNVRFTVFGLAQPGGSKRIVPAGKTGGHRVIDDNPKARPWKQVVAVQAAIARDTFDMASHSLFDRPLRVVMVFYRPRPKGHLRCDGELNAAGLRCPAPGTKPDVLKLARSTEDALTGVLWRDDALITTELIFKRWGEPARLEILVEEDAGFESPLDHA